MCIRDSHWPLVLALFLTVGVGVFFGFLNGFMVAKLKLPPFISTLGTMMMSQGFGSIITKVQSQTCLLYTSSSSRC